MRGRTCVRHGVCFIRSAMHWRASTTSLGTILLAGGTLVATACGSELDIDRLGAGEEIPDAGPGAGGEGPDGSLGGPSSSGGSSGASGSSGGADGGGDAGWNAPVMEPGAAWSAVGWTKMASSTNKVLRAVWGSSSTDVWAGGEGGALVHFDGAAWSTRASSLDSQSHVMAIDGSARDDVYLLEYRTDATRMHHFDGVSWSEVTTFPGISQIFCLDVPARGTAYVYGAPTHSATPDASLSLRLYRVVGATAAGRQLLGTTTSVSASGYCSVHAFAENDVWVTGSPLSRWNGSAFVPLAASPPSSELLSVVAPNQAFARLHVWNGAAWQSQTTGIAGALMKVSGRSTSLAFGIVANGSATVVRYAGGGWTKETTPAGASLTDVWMAPNGRTFAVGYDGQVLSGP